MDSKYAGKVIVLPKELAAKLIAKQKALTAKLGFEPSLSEVVAYILNQAKSE